MRSLSLWSDVAADAVLQLAAQLPRPSRQTSTSTSGLKSTIRLVQQCPRLQSLKLEKFNFSRPPESSLFSPLLSSLAQNNSLDSVNLSLLTVRSTNVVQDVLQNLPRSLRYLNLTLTGLWIRDDVNRQPAGMRRRQLQLDCAMRSDWSIYPCLSDIRIQCRSASVTSKVLTMFFPSCPALISLHLFSIDQKNLERLGYVLTAHCPKLQKLTFQDGYFEECSLVHLLRSPTASVVSGSWPWRLAAFTLDTPSYLDDHFMRLLIEYCGRSLSSLSFSSRVDLPSPVIQQLLCSCPRLVSFTVTSACLPQTPETVSEESPGFYSVLNASDIVQGMEVTESWVCLDMEELNIDTMDDCGPEAHETKRMFDVVLQQMKTLTHLRNKNVL